MIDVALTSAELRAADVAVVIDVLRATSSATQALASGYQRVLCAESNELAMELRMPGRVLAGERNCVKPAGFDQGNSPTETLDVRGEELVLATTNGAPAIVASTLHAPRVVLACMLNLGAVIGSVVGAVRADPDVDVQIVCSGTDGHVALEDVYVAGRLCAALPGERTDSARVAEAVARAFTTPFDALAASADAAKLRAAEMAGDIAECAVESALDIVPTVIASAGGVATVCAGAGSRVHSQAVDQDDTVSV